MFEPIEDEERDAILQEAYSKTRKSLIARLDNWEDQKSWDDFYQTYWRLIYSTAIKSGLRSEEAFDCVQETILAIAKQSKKQMYDPEQGSFKAWLMNMTRWRINDQFRKRRKDTAAEIVTFSDENTANQVEQIVDPDSGVLERLWESEWQQNLTIAALARVKANVSPLQYQIFYYYVIKEWDTKRVQKQLDVSVGQIYLAKHRIGSLLKKELARLEKDAE